MKTELQLLTDEQLLEEIKCQWYNKELFDYELNQLPEEQAFTPANDYMDSDIEQHIEALEREYKSRGLELPDRYEYVGEFMPDDADEAGFDYDLDSGFPDYDEEVGDWTEGVPD